MQTATGPRDWDKIVKESNGQLFYLPESLVESAKQWSKDRGAFHAKVNDLAAAENALGMLFTQLIFAIRKEFEKRGSIENVWTQDIGFQTEALKEGKYIIQFTPNNKLN